MASNTSINLEQVNQAIAYMQDVIKHLNDVQDTTQTASQEVHQGWDSSEAAPNFQGILGKWSGKLPDLLADSQKILAFLQEAHDQYLSAEKTAAGGA